MIRILFILLILYSIKGEQIQNLEENNVIEIDKENKNLLEQYDNWFLFFGSPYCPYCIKFLPVWKAIADEAKKLDIKTGAINCLLDPEICQYYNIQKYPTIYLKNKDQFYEFEGQREYQNLLDFLYLDHKNKKSILIENIKQRKSDQLNSFKFYKIYLKKNPEIIFSVFAITFLIIVFANIIQKNFK